MLRSYKITFILLVQLIDIGQLMYLLLNASVVFYNTIVTNKLFWQGFELFTPYPVL